MLGKDVMRETDEIDVPESVAPPSVAPSIWDYRRRWLTIGLVLTVVGAAFEALAVATILPITVRELGGLSLYGWAFSAFMLTNLIGITIAGGEADRLGPVRPFVIGVGLFVIGLSVSGLAPTMPVLIAGRSVQGLGAGFISSISYLAIARGYPDELKPQMLAVISSAWVVPGLVGPVLASGVAAIAGWRWVFLGLAPIITIAGALAFPALRDLGGGTSGAHNWRRSLAALGLAGGAGLLVSALAAHGLARNLGLLVVGLILGLPALRRLAPAGTLRAAAGVPAAIVTCGLLNMAFFGVDAFVPLGLTAVRGQTPAVAGLALTAATLTWTTGAWLQARLASRRGRRQLTRVGLLVVAAGIAAAAALLLPAVPPLLAPLAWGLAGLGMGLGYSTLSLVVLEGAESGQEGTATSALQMMNVLGSALGTGIGGALIAHANAGGAGPGPGITQQDLAMLGVICVALLATRRLPGHVRKP